MGFYDAFQDIDWVRVGWTLLIFIPYIDKEWVAVLPPLAAVIPGVSPINVIDLSWMERLRLAIVLLLPGLDGEVLNLAGIELEDVIMD